MAEILEKLKTRRVQKRGGTVTLFYPYKINLVLKQLNLTDEQTSKVKQAIVSAVINTDKDTPFQTKDLWDIIYQNLPEDAKKSYSDYRQNEVKEFANATDPQYKMNQLFNHERSVVNENANKDSRRFNTKRDLLSGAAARALGLRMMPDIVAKAHQRGDIHWHDLDYSPLFPYTNCSLPDFKDMLAHGFKIGNAKVTSPKSIDVAVSLIAQAIAAIASEQYGLETAVL